MASGPALHHTQEGKDVLPRDLRGRADAAGHKRGPKIKQSGSDHRKNRLDPYSHRLQQPPRCRYFCDLLLFIFWVWIVVRFLKKPLQCFKGLFGPYVIWRVVVETHDPIACRPEELELHTESLLSIFRPAQLSATGHALDRRFPLLFELVEV